MLNFDKYRKEISEIAYDEEFFDICKCVYKLREGEECLGYCSECINNTIKWLSSEYDPPLLENGDELKPGDWIMVKDPDDGTWCKKIFAYYFDGCFYCANDIAFFKNGLLIKRQKARLPEEGE